MAGSWQFWALMSAVFAALTALLAKMGVQDVPSDVATFIRTIIILLLVGGILVATGQFDAIGGVGRQSLVFLILSGLATGASWLCYFRALKLGELSKVAPLDKLSVVLAALLGVLVLGERLSAASWTGVTLIALGAAVIAWQG